MSLIKFRGKTPQLGQKCWLAPSAVISGDVQLGDDVSFWFHTVARGDVHWIRIGNGTNIQDGSVLHVSDGTFPLLIGSGVTVGHRAIVHGCTLEDHVLVGMGSQVLDGAVVEAEAQIGAGAVVPPGMRVPAGHLVMGVPARVKRSLTEPEKAANRAVKDRYIALKEEYRSELDR